MLGFFLFFFGCQEELLLVFPFYDMHCDCISSFILPFWVLCWIHIVFSFLSSIVEIRNIVKMLYAWVFPYIFRSCKTWLFVSWLTVGAKAKLIGLVLLNFSFSIRIVVSGSSPFNLHVVVVFWRILDVLEQSKGYWCPIFVLL